MATMHTTGTAMRPPDLPGPGRIQVLRQADGSVTFQMGGPLSEELALELRNQLGAQFCRHATLDFSELESFGSFSLALLVAILGEHLRANAGRTVRILGASAEQRGVMRRLGLDLGEYGEVRPSGRRPEQQGSAG